MGYVSFREGTSFKLLFFWGGEMKQMEIYGHFEAFFRLVKETPDFRAAYLLG